MSYRIAVASSEGKVIDLSFGEAKNFLIFEVDERQQYKLSEIRKWEEPDLADATGNTESGGCGTGTGCGGGGADIPKLSLVEDCRCILCKKLGFQVRKQLERKAISAFDIEEPVDGAIEKIAAYFDKLDNHKTLRGIAHGNNADKPKQKGE